MGTLWYTVSPARVDCLEGVDCRLWIRGGVWLRSVVIFIGRMGRAIFVLLRLIWKGWRVYDKVSSPINGGNGRYAVVGAAEK